MWLTKPKIFTKPDRRYETYDKAMKLINLKKRDMVRHNLPGKFTDFEIHEIEITINEIKVTKEK